jgi:hypothetical protein
MSKNYEAAPKPVSPYSDAKHQDYLSAGNTVQVCAHGESGGDTLMHKEMAKKKRKAA